MGNDRLGLRVGGSGHWGRHVILGGSSSLTSREPCAGHLVLALGLVSWG